MSLTHAINNQTLFSRITFPNNCCNFNFSDTDEELALDGSFDQDLKNYHRLHWEAEFKPVAQQLLNRIQTHRTFLEPLPIPSF